MADDVPSPVRWAPGWPAATYHIVERPLIAGRMRSLCNLVLDVGEDQAVTEVAESAHACRSCLEIAREREAI